MLKKIIFLLCLIAALPIIILASKNSQVVEINYILGVFKINLSYLIILAFVLGVVAMLPFFAFTGMIWKIRTKNLQKEVDKMEKQKQKDLIREEFLED